MNQKLRLSLIVTILCLSVVWAQEEEAEAPDYGWKKEMVGTLNFTQTALSNWTQGGESNWTGQLDVNAKFENDQEGFNWVNGGKISYGKTKTGDADAVKSVDEIRLETVYTKKMDFVVNPYVAATALSQLDEGVDLESGLVVSKLLNPAYFTESIGVGREINESLKTRAGLAFKQTYVGDEQFAPTYTDDLATTTELETMRSEVGIESVTEFGKEIMENVQLTSKLELFSDLQGMEADSLNGLAEDLSMLNRVDVRWDNILSSQVNKYITVSFNVQLFYDSDISRKRQLKQVLAVGLTYNFLE